MEPSESCISSMKRSASMMLEGSSTMRYSGTTLHVHLEGQKHSQESIRQILNTDGIEVEELRVVPAGLEDAFLYLTRPTKNEMSTEAS